MSEKMRKRLEAGLVRGADGVVRCWWATEDPLYVDYHDHEWGLPVTDDSRLFEKICLEGFQAGLSWLTILRKREAFRRGFKRFEIRRVARFGPRDVERLLDDSSIVRHRGKIESAINNACRAMALCEEFGSLAAYFWKWEPDARSRPPRVTRRVLTRLGPSPEAVALSKDLKRRGWTFVGPTTVYAFMQAMGLVNDHLEGCASRRFAQSARRALDRPAGASHDDDPGRSSSACTLGPWLPTAIRSSISPLRGGSNAQRRRPTRRR